MRRFLFLLLAVLMALVVALPAGAGKPDCSTYPAGHPQACQSDDPTPEPIGAGTVCGPDEYPDGIEGIQSADFSFTLGGKQDGACIDVISTESDPGKGWEVTITGSGAHYLGVIPRDSISAGDSCGGYLLRSEARIYTTRTLGYDGFMPAATINACGTDFAEWVNTDLWADVEPILVDIGGVCEVVEGAQCLVAKKLNVEHPLVLQAFLRGSADGETTFYVDLPPLDSDWPEVP